MIVVDCSALVDVLTGADNTEALRARIVQSEVHAPSLLDFEVVSALRGLTLAGRLSETRAQDFLTDFEAMPIQRWPSGDSLRRRAFSLRNNISAYDAAYVVLAEALGCPLLTRDERLARTGGHTAQIDVL